MRTYVFIPPVRRAAGGVFVLLRLARCLNRAGHETVLVPREDATELPDDLPCTAWDDLRLEPGDLWLVPEGWVNALAPGLNARARCLVYVQNWAYLFSGLPHGVDWRQLDVSFLAVSQPVGWYVERMLGRGAEVLRPSIDLDLFGQSGAKPDGPLRIAFMPRKNKAQAERIREALAARNHGGGEVEWLPVDGLPPEGVASALAAAHVFLATGFPEGCPLPPLEAMASGCLCAGFTGFGGTDYMRQAGDFPGAFEPWWPVRETPWGGNGLWCADADVPAAVEALEQAQAWWREGDPRLETTLEQARATARAYGIEQQAQAAEALWHKLKGAD
ncbi:group 1 glycosyl transferase [Desulfohalovibrio reitneri]|uniref:group 1 glycosyl transferase n=1 Tax=Desulfohalovibrio reitneri TaxID=1307759 RepID=UPI00054D63EC|nr:group 1 glycosyl transferase [Desulfohalovibrio reitneri]